MSVADLLDDSQLKAPSLYHHFGNKEGLYIAFVEASFHHLNERLKAVSAGNGSTETRLRQAAYAIMEGQPFDLLQVRRDLNLMSRSSHVQVVRSWAHEYLYCPIGQIFEQGIASKEIPEDDPMRLAHLFVHSVFSLHPVYALESRPSTDAYHWLVDKFMAK